MSRDEVLDWVRKAKWILVDMGRMHVAGEYEDAEVHLTCGTPVAGLKAWSRGIVPPGKRGHVRLVLEPPVNARAKAFLFGLINSLEE